MMVSFCAVLSRNVLNEILDLIESASEDLPTYSYLFINIFIVFQRK